MVVAAILLSAQHDLIAEEKKGLRFVNGGRHRRSGCYDLWLQPVNLKE